MLDRLADSPLWVQLRDKLRTSIVDGSLPAGSPLPTEYQLRDEHGVSRSVVRQALASLESEGLVDRRPGRGSIVTSPLAHHRRAEQAGGLREHLAARGLELRTVLKRYALVPAPPDVARELEDVQAWQLDRVRFIDGTAAISMQTWVSHARFPGLNASMVEHGSLLEALAGLGARPAGGPRRFQAVPANHEVAMDLGVERGTPVLLMSGVTQDLAGHALEVFRAWHEPHMVFDTEARVSLARQTVENSASR
ncbi:GntR family transcriptional regulator [Ornithinimicrobium cerasi]|uniref:GntR family transcriptional regulator n=1 Tax=Ornithinimicrobium cerasi TaxID=2248773 RepID=UPI000EFE3AFB|nr:GntR family transcriptional regulator [Ornithinimicrobium cerasi]